MRWVALDTETGGFDPRTCGVCEFAFVEIDDVGREIDRYASLIDPEAPITAGAAGVHGILNEHVVDAPTLAEMMTICRDRPFAQGPIAFIAHNAPFDWSFLHPWFPEDTQLMCTLRLARQIYPEAENHKLQTLRVWLGLGSSRTDQHSAAGDVDVLVALLGRMRADTDLDLPGLLKLSQAPIPVARIGFGKHKGNRLADLPKDYVQWLTGPKGPEKLDPDLKAALLAL